MCIFITFLVIKYLARDGRREEGFFYVTDQGTTDHHGEGNKRQLISLHSKAGIREINAGA